jgi:hypothetical protein
MRTLVGVNSGRRQPGHEEIYVSYSGRCDGVAVNDFEGFVLVGVEDGEHALVMTDMI